jgi:hypothetical protein
VAGPLPTGPATGCPPLLPVGASDARVGMSLVQRDLPAEGSLTGAVRSLAQSGRLGSRQHRPAGVGALFEPSGDAMRGGCHVSDAAPRLDKIKDLAAKLRRVTPSAHTASWHPGTSNQTPGKPGHTSARGDATMG